METIKRLRTETEELKYAYLDKTEKWANEQVQRNLERLFRQRRLTLSDKVAQEDQRMILVTQSEYHKEQKWAYLSPKWYFTEGFVSRAITKAERHYEDCLVKLCDRIAEKGLEGELTISGARLGVNFDLTITDGKKTVRAFTIIAEGPIQRPHYRYLVK